MSMATLITETVNWGWLTVQKFSPLSSWQETRWHDTDMVPKRWLRVLHLDLQATGRESVTGPQLEHLKP